MATEHPLSNGSRRETDRYDRCLLRPMGRDGDPPFRTEHLIDATLVGLLTFAAVILVDVLPSLLSGNPVFLSPEQIWLRIPTAATGFLLAFAFMWLRARGIDALNIFRRLLEE